MSLFGQLDAENIPSNPFFIEKGEYSTEVTKAEYTTNKDGERVLHIVYTIEDEYSDYDKKQAHQRFTLVPAEMTAEMFELLPADEKKTIRARNSAIKRTLCGAEGNKNMRGLEIEANDLNDPAWDPKVLVGKKATVAIDNWGENKTGVKIQWVNAISE